MASNSDDDHGGGRPVRTGWGRGCLVALLVTLVACGDQNSLEAGSDSDDEALVVERTAFRPGEVVALTASPKAQRRIYDGKIYLVGRGNVWSLKLATTAEGAEPAYLLPPGPIGGRTALALFDTEHLFARLPDVVVGESRLCYLPEETPCTTITVE